VQTVDTVENYKLITNEKVTDWREVQYIRKSRELEVLLVRFGYTELEVFP